MCNGVTQAVEEKGSLEMKIESMRYRFTPMKIVAWNFKSDNKCWYLCRGTEPLLHGLWEYKTICAHWKMVWKFLMSIYLFYDPVIIFLGICSRDICINFIDNSPKLEKIQISISRKMDKHISVHLYKGILLSKRKEWTTETFNIDEFHRHYVEQKKSDINGYLLYKSIYIKFKKRQI